MKVSMEAVYLVEPSSLAVRLSIQDFWLVIVFQRPPCRSSEHEVPFRGLHLTETIKPLSIVEAGVRIPIV